MIDSKLFTVLCGFAGAAIGIVVIFVLPPAQVILGLGAMALVTAVLLFWNSLRTLGGETPIVVDLPRGETGAAEARTQQKRMLLRALKDLENEKKIGKISDEDFDDVGRRYRDEIKAIMKDIDAAAEPFRKKAEDVARAHLAAKGLTDDAAKSNVEPAATVASAPLSADDSSASLPDDDDDVETKKSLDHDSQGNKTSAPARPKCPSCGESNEPDAKFCKSCATPMKAATPTSDSQKIEAPPSTVDAPTDRRPEPVTEANAEKLAESPAENADGKVAAKEGGIDA